MTEQDNGEAETRKSLAEGHGITFPNAEEAIKWLKGGGKMDIEQFKKDALEAITRALDPEWHNEGYPVMAEVVLDQILAHSFLVSLMDKAKKYDELLEQTKETCPDCKGMGFRDKLMAQHKVDGITAIDTYSDWCLTCDGTGKTEHPERLVVLDKDQNLPVSKLGLSLEQAIGLKKMGWQRTNQDIGK